MSPATRQRQPMTMVTLARTFAIGLLLVLVPQVVPAVAAESSTPIPTPAPPNPIAQDRLFVLQKYAELLSVYDPITGRRAGGAVRVTPIPHEMIATADGQELFVTGYGVKTFLDKDEGGNTLTVIDTRRIAAVGFVDLGAFRRPHGLARGRSGRIYVTTDAPAALLVVEPARRTVVEHFETDQVLPHMVEVTPDESNAVIANAGSGTVTILPLRASAGDTKAQSPARQVRVGGSPMGILLSADGRFAYVANREGNQIVVVDIAQHKVARTIACEGEPSRLAWLPSGQQLIVTLLKAGAVAIVDRDSGVEARRVSVGRRPEGMAVDGAHNRVYVAVQDDNQIVALSTTDWKVQRSIATAEHPDALWLTTAPRDPLAAAQGTDVGEIDGNATSLLSPARLDTYVPASTPARAAWDKYLALSASTRRSDQALIEGELRALRMSRMSPASFARGFKLEDKMNADWFRGTEGRHMLDTLLSFQTPSGGWSKHVDMRGPKRLPGESFYSEDDRWNYIATIDNDTTTEHLRFLAAAFAATKDVRARDGFTRGIAYLLQAQFPNGGWPQVYPLQGGYHDAITFNDNAMINVLRLLGDVVIGRFAFVAPALRQRATDAVAMGHRCLLSTQVVAGGVRRAWGQQHDPLTLAPIAGRRYELAALTGRESAEIVKYLMSLPQPPAELVEAVHAAVVWFRLHAIYGFDYNMHSGLRLAKNGSMTPPVWARLYEIGTERPLFSDRDGVPKYDWSLLTDRRFGYGWFSQEPAKAIAVYDTFWSIQHPVRTFEATDMLPR